MSHSLVRAIATVGGMTLLSRVSGLVRDVVVANYLGSTAGADAFFVAFRIPNFLRRIFAEGAFSSAFVPVLSDVQSKRDGAEVKAFLDLASGRFAAVLLLVTLVGVSAAPILVSILAPGFHLNDPQRYYLTVDALRIVFPYLFFISLVAMAAGIFNANERFAVPAATPILLNVCLVGALLALTPMTPNPTVALSIGVLIAGAVQLLFQLPFLSEIGLLPRPKLLAGSAVDAAGSVRRVFALMVPGIVGTSVAQINLLINTVIASFLAAGSVSWLYYSDRLMEFPLGVFGIALATVILPSLSKLHAAGDSASFNDTLDWALRLTALIATPATVGLVVLAIPALSTIYLHGAFTERDAEMSADALVAFSIGLLGFVSVKVLAPGFHARQDTRTPVKIGITAMIVNIAACVVLAWPLGHVGLALATSIAAVVNAAMLFVVLRRRGIYTPKPGWLGFAVRVGIANVVMGAVLFGLRGERQQWFDAAMTTRLGWLLALVALGGGVYFSVILALGINLKAMLMRRATER